MKCALADCRKILVAVKNPRQKSEPAILKAAQLAGALGAEIELYHAIDMSIDVDQIALAGEDPQEFQRNLCEQHTTQLESIAKRLRLDGLRVSVVVEWDYPVFEAVVRRASDTQAGLIVAACHIRHH